MASYWDVKSVHTSGKWADLPAAPSLRSKLPPVQVLVPIEGCPVQHPILAMILQETAEVHQVMVDLCQVCEQTAWMSVRAVSEEWGK